MQHRIEFSTALLIAIKSKRSKSSKLQPKVNGIKVNAVNNITKSKYAVVDARGNFVIAPKRRYVII